MKCPECQFTNHEGLNFCGNCGAELGTPCPHCLFVNPPRFNYCGKCGYDLKKVSEGADTQTSQKARHAGGDVPIAVGSIGSERKQVTVLFSDLSGYTAMSETLDPEVVKEIMNRIFGEVAQVVTRYEGFIDKFIGDAVMVLFGVPRAHEDDPFRALMAAREIHEVVDVISSQIENQIGRPVSMHTGINTGLVVTDEMDIAKGKHGMTGSTINLASRLTDMAKAGEIVVGPDTYRLMQGYFDFEKIEPAQVKGKATPVHAFKLRSLKKRPVKTHRPSGLRADLIGRKAEMAQLAEAVSRLREGRGTVFSLCGDMGTGKSRLVEEFKATLDTDDIQWWDGHSYAYSQNIPYFPFTDFLGTFFRIVEGDSADEVRDKIDTAVRDLLGEKEHVIPYIGTLFSLDYPQIEEVSPELWKTRLHAAVRSVISALARTRPVIICFEDLHWADPSSAELLRFILTDFRESALCICMFRPSFQLFPVHSGREPEDIHHEIFLCDLSASNSQDMVTSLLKTTDIPGELKRFVRKKTEGNPFYLEEVINSLVDSRTLVHDNGAWRLQRSLAEAHIPATIQGVISARIDRLEQGAKRVLQEASVIGKAFFYDILMRITDSGDYLDGALNNLEKVDVIKRRSFQSDVEYIFKHAMTQEVAYNSLLRRERELIHERIASVMEELYHHRISEFYEIIAFHYGKSRSHIKAVDYLMKSAEKSFGRYALDEAHRYYHDAFSLLSDIPENTAYDRGLSVDLINRWAVVYNQRGDYNGLLTVLQEHEGLAASLDDKEKTGMFYGWFGWALRQREDLHEAYRYLSRALECGEDTDNRRLVGYACAWLTQICADLGRLDEAIALGKRAQEFSELLETDQLYFQFCMFGMGLAHYFRGEGKEQLEIGASLLEYGNAQSDIRSTAMGHNICGLGYSTAGDFLKAIQCFRNAIRISLDPMISCLSRFLLGMSYLSTGQLGEAEQTLDEVMKFNRVYGLEAIGTSAHALMSIILIAKGNLREGVKQAEDTLEIFKKNGSQYRYATVVHLLGKVYLQIAQGERRGNISFLAKNLAFLVRNVPRAETKAEEHLRDAIDIATDIGAKGLLGQAKLDFGLLHMSKGRGEEARRCIEEAIDIFEQYGAEGYLKQARSMFSSL